MKTIYSNFKKLNEEKKNMIINAALKEFVQNGFDKASTNEIVKEAQISKGSLFNYFYSKKDLYIFLVDYSAEAIDGLYEEMDLTETDLFERIENIGLQKLHIHKGYPRVFDFLAAAMQEESVEVKDLIKDKVDSIYERGTELIYKDIDYSKFRDGLDVEKAIEIFNWTMFGYGEKAIQHIDSFVDMGDFGEKYLREWQRYSDILKNCFYK